MHSPWIRASGTIKFNLGRPVSWLMSSIYNTHNRYIPFLRILSSRKLFNWGNGYVRKTSIGPSKQYFPLVSTQSLTVVLSKSPSWSPLLVNSFFNQLSNRKVQKVLMRGFFSFLTLNSLSVTSSLPKASCNNDNQDSSSVLPSGSITCTSSPTVPKVTSWLLGKKKKREIP